MTQIRYLDFLNIIQLDINIWSGQTRLSTSDIKLGTGGEIPPENLIHLGTKKICDPVKLNSFHRLKTKANRLCLQHGIPFMNGFALPSGSATNDTRSKLEDIVLEFQREKQKFINNYDADIDAWIKNNPNYEDVIRIGSMPSYEVEKRLGFEYQIFKIQPTVNCQASAQKLEIKVQGLADQLIDEVVEKANKLYTEKFAGCQQCSVRTRVVLQSLRDKIHGLSFLNSEFFSWLIDMLDKTLHGYDVHAQGNQIVAPFFYQAMAAVAIMRDRSKIEDYANGLFTQEEIAAYLESGQQTSHALSVGLPGNTNTEGTDGQSNDEAVLEEPEQSKSFESFVDDMSEDCFF